MEDKQLTIEILKLVISFSTPIIVVIFGLKISRRLEETKLNVLKEKEWQVKWAEIFFKHATELNEHVSIVICCMHDLQNEKDKKKADTITDRIFSCASKISEIDWNIRNYAQFSVVYGNEVIESQKKLLAMMGELLSTKKGDLEKIRVQQFAYNNAVRKAHNDILNSK